MSWNDIELSGHNHRHKCPQCEEIRWHYGTRAECLEPDICDRDAALADMELVIDELVQEEIAHERRSNPNS